MHNIILITRGKEKKATHAGACRFDTLEDSFYFCKTINQLELKDDEWINARIIKMNKRYPVIKPEPIDFSVIESLDDRSIQRMMRDIDSQMLSKVLTGSSEEFQQKIFSNMSKRAAQMLREDMEFTEPADEEELEDIRKHLITIYRNIKDERERGNHIDKPPVEKFTRKVNKTRKKKFSQNEHTNSDIVLTMYGQDDSVTDVSVALFDHCGMDAHYYCQLIDKLKVREGRWVYTKYTEPMHEHELKRPVLVEFEQIMHLPNFIVHKALAYFYDHSIAIALQNTTEEVRDKILKNVYAKVLPSIKEQMENIENKTRYPDPDVIKRIQKEIITKAIEIEAATEYEVLMD